MDKLTSTRGEQNEPTEIYGSLDMDDIHTLSLSISHDWHQRMEFQRQGENDKATALLEDLLHYSRKLLAAYSEKINLYPQQIKSMDADVREQIENEVHLALRLNCKLILNSDEIPDNIEDED